ncbi:alpha/beta hydrolase fold protein [Thermocrinis albus DSM 14484]|uniref:Alpha/beta hydrolase fold protein n=1 Tax=Thermocrinis albus (strain DSM 14484 / JCM 11386 / HI 11/12) TaxID=638303 RepID=D3SMZ6_THEAH|nr:alpha/beta fold hydrolase [Thermocrinis albus]ADC90126.1 alpha/beta hydrolase fold protein [Thermocrinis albus DSM 14484]
MSANVFLHGWGFSSKVFRHFEGIKIDLPYHGRSSLRYTSLDKLVEEIALRVPPHSLLVGWSLGGSVALLLAHRFPKKVKSLILIGTTAHFRRYWPEKNLRGFLLKVRQKRDSFLWHFRRLAYGREFTDALDIDGATELLEDYMNLNLFPLLPTIRKPVIILHGVLDQVVPLRAALDLYRRLPKAKFLSFAGGHFPLHEDTIRKVLKGVSQL